MQSLVRWNRRVFCFLALLLAVPFPALAQKAVVEESVTEINCDSRTHAVVHYRRVTTILNAQGASLASFVCSVGGNDRLTSFRGSVTDGSGRVIRKLREKDLKYTEYSPYLAIDEHQEYLEYTPPTYPVTVTYEWTIDSHDNLIEFPRFCPQTDYDVSVKKAVYRLTVPKSMEIRHATQNISQTVMMADSSKYSKTLVLALGPLPPLCREPYSRPLGERCPVAYFTPSDFVYYGTRGSLRSWNDYGLWEYSLINGSEALPEDVCQRLHQLTNGLSDREKVAALYQELGKTTRYVAILLGIGGQRPASAAGVCRSGYGDCKGLSNYMRAMLKEVGIPSYYTTISTRNRRLMPDFASVGQLDHVILEVPLPGDTLWLECTNPRLPMGYVHEDIAGHDAVEIGPKGGRLVRLPAYADTANVMHSGVRVEVDGSGAAEMILFREWRNRQYERYAPLIAMDGKKRQEALLRMLKVPQTEIQRLDLRDDGTSLTVDAAANCQRYATVTGQRLFLPVSPLRCNYSVPSAASGRQQDVWIETGYSDEERITLVIPDGYAIEALPRAVTLQQPFGEFHFSIRPEGREVRIKSRVLIKAGSYDKSLYPDLAAFAKAVDSAFSQKIVIKKT